MTNRWGLGLSVLGVAALVAGCAPAPAHPVPPDPLEPYVGVWKHVADEGGPETLTIKSGGAFDWQIVNDSGKSCVIAGTVAFAMVADTGVHEGDDDGDDGYDGASPGDDDEGDDGDHENPCSGGEGESAMNLFRAMPSNGNGGGAGGVGIGAPPRVQPGPPASDASAPAAGATRPQLQWTMTTNTCNPSYQGRTTGDWVVHVDAEHLGLTDADPDIQATQVVEYTRQH